MGKRYAKDSIILKTVHLNGLEKEKNLRNLFYKFANWYQKKYRGKVACGIGIRTDESLNRFRTIAFQEKKITFENYNWTTKLKLNEKHIDVYNFYPIYDWKVEDIWGAVSKLDLKFNYIYELMYKKWT